MSTSTSSSASSHPFTVHIDWRETPEAHIIKGDVPGLKGRDVKVEVVDESFLEISGERVVGAGEEAEDSEWHMTERVRGKFVRRLKMPENANLMELVASVKYGVVTVTVPKKLPDDDVMVAESSKGSDDREGFYVDDMLAELTGFN